MTPNITNPETRRRLALGLISAPVSRNRKRSLARAIFSGWCGYTLGLVRRDPIAWLLAAALLLPSIAAILATLIR